MGWEKNCTNVRWKQIKSVDPFSGHFCIEPQQQQRSAVLGARVRGRVRYLISISTLARYSALGPSTK